MLKELRKLAYLSMALAALSYGSQTANAAPGDATGAVFTSAGSCVGNSLNFVSGTTGADCVTTTGHISASVVGTLSINEIRAIGFGNMASPCAGAACTGTATNAALIRLDPSNGARTLTTPGTDTVVLLHGTSANDGGNTAGTGGSAPGADNSGGQSVGVLRISGANEGAATQVYISFADNTGEPVDFRGEDNFTNNDTNIHVIGPTSAYFTVQDFEINCDGMIVGDGGAFPHTPGNDAYGHFCSNAVLPLDVKVGATLATAAGQTYTVGKYVGTYNAMVTY